MNKPQLKRKSWKHNFNAVLTGIYNTQAWLAMFIFIILTAVVSLQVVTRYVFHTPYLWTEEVARYLLFWVTLMGAALSVNTQRHFKIDFFKYSSIKNIKIRKSLEVIPKIAIFLLALIMVVSGIKYFNMSNLRMGRLSNVNMKYVFLAIPISGVTMMLYSIKHMISIITRKVNPESFTKET